MIIDDEFYFREALKITLPWNELGFRICGEAKNGKDALEKIEELKPDIALVDINMPIMDGLEFTQAIIQEKYKIKIIILTGYSEFSYAKQAIQYGVKSYLLKPIDESELEKTLLQTKNIIESERKIKVEIEQLKERVRESMPILRDKVLNQLIQGNYTLNFEEIESKFEYLNINIISKHYQVIVIELGDENNFAYTQEDKHLWGFAISNMIYEVFKDSITYEVFRDNLERVCIITAFNDENSEEFYLKLESKLDQIKELVQLYLKFTISIGVGNAKEDIRDISVSYNEAMIALKDRIIRGKNQVILYSSISQTCLTTNIYSIEYRNQLLMSMRIGDIEQTGKLITLIFQEVRKRNINHELLLVICIEMISTCMQFSGESGHDFINISGDNQYNIIEKIQSKKTLDEIENWMRDTIFSTLSYIENNKISKSSKIVEKIKKYIEDNYQNEGLNIQELAKHLYIAYSHICYLFKKETGATINEFITEYRLKKAKELFDSGNHFIIDVANKVGYADANYFGKCFKKYYGISPSKYSEVIK
jgi:two-component system response regulator YesN